MSNHQLNRMQDTLSPAEKRMYEWAFSASKMGVWRYDLANHAWLVSDQAMQVFGFTEAALIERESLMARLSNVDRLRVDTAWNMLLHDAQPFNIEYEITDSQGPRWVWEKAEIECDEVGEPCHLIGVVQDISERRIQDKELFRRANYDVLTGLPNRQVLDEYLDKSFALCHRRNERMALMAIDLDRFKEVNDTYGHAAGDLVLQMASRRMEACLRASDMVARQGGDEFIAVLQGVDHDAMAGVVALRLIEEISRPYEIQGKQISIGASVGIALLPEDGLDRDEVMSRADSALYVAKRRGRETLHFFQKELN
jgi:diguanylate cyclase (GGDEF)-like protein/PAS domain S-box-containing protein